MLKAIIDSAGPRAAYARVTRGGSTCFAPIVGWLEVRGDGPEPFAGYALVVDSAGGILQVEASEVLFLEPDAAGWLQVVTNG